MTPAPVEQPTLEMPSTNIERLCDRADRLLYGETPTGDWHDLSPAARRWFARQQLVFGRGAYER